MDAVTLPLFRVIRPENQLFLEPRQTFALGQAPILQRSLAEEIMKKLFLVTAFAALTFPIVARADSPQEKQRERAAYRIEQAYERDSVLRRFDLEADSEGDRVGYIELEGRVQTAAQRQRAETIARTHGRGYTIRNRIKVGSKARGGR